MQLQSLINPRTFCSIFLQAILLCSMSLTSKPGTAIANPFGNETDRFALMKIKESISSDPHGIMSSWNNSAHFCKWPGISCSIRHQRVTALDLDGFELRGIISPFIGNLSFLRLITLANNSFSGKIPQQVGRLFRLRQLILANNFLLEGKIPANLSHCLELRRFDCGNNNLSGSIPSELGSLSKLRYLILRLNNFSGTLPPSLGNLSSLIEIWLEGSEELVGNIPTEFGRLRNLNSFTASVCSLSGIVPLSLYNISSLRHLIIAVNKFSTGALPPNIGLTLPNLRTLYVARTNLSGMIPESLSNASRLQKLDIAGNNFFGQVPISFGNLHELTGFFLNVNWLGDYSVDSLAFIKHLTNCSKLETLAMGDNRFGGRLPDSITNLTTQLRTLNLVNNQIYGTIPATIENLAGLTVLVLRENLVSGVIPASLGKLRKLQFLDLSFNSISGKIPPTIGNLSRLNALGLGNNKLYGSIPSELSNCQKLQYLILWNNNLTGEIPAELFRVSTFIFVNLSVNSLTGRVPVQVGNLKNAFEIDFSENSLTGEIPESFGGCEVLENLFLQGNNFQGTLPYALASLESLYYLDVSHNNLTGEIPKRLEELKYMNIINLAFNNLEGEVPKLGVFHNLSKVSIAGNPKLCGGIPELELPRCPSKDSESKTTNTRKLIITIVCVVGFFLLFSGFTIFFWKRKSRKKTVDPLSTINLLSTVSYQRLHQATSGFSSTMLIGTGSFGMVYKGILDSVENLVAIKVLNLQRNGAEKSFIAECNALRNIRHRNLVKVLTCCSSMDYSGNEFRALVFEYMPNGSLEKWLHHPVAGDEHGSRSLNLIQRLNIAVDVASVIYYLHEDCGQPVIHRDLKPSNVLLNDEMVAHVSDFGIARLISNTTSVSEEVSTIGIKGTIGYAAPEYAMGGEPSKLGDVYSFGVLLLEMFTGKRPTEEIFKDDFTLHNFVMTALPERFVQVVDPSLLRREERATPLSTQESSLHQEIEVEEVQRNSTISAHLQECLVSVLQIGLACSKDSPIERMNMEDVTTELHHIRNAYAAADIYSN